MARDSVRMKAHVNLMMITDLFDEAVDDSIETFFTAAFLLHPIQVTVITLRSHEHCIVAICIGLTYTYFS